MSGGTESIPSPKGTELSKPPQSSRIPKMSSSLPSGQNMLSPALLSAKLSTLLSLSSVKGREITSNKVSRTPSPRTPGQLLRPSTAGVMPPPTTPSSIGRPSSAGVSGQKYSPRVDTPCVFRDCKSSLKDTKTNSSISPQTKLGPTLKPPTDKTKNAKIHSKPPGDSSTRNTLKTKATAAVNSVKPGNTNKILKRPPFPLGNSVRKTVSLNTLNPNSSSSTIKVSSTGNKENTNSKRSVTKNNKVNTAQPCNVLKPKVVNNTMKTSNATALPKQTQTAKVTVKPTATTSKPSKSISTPSSKPLILEPRSSSKANNLNDKFILTLLATKQEEFVSITPKLISKIKSPSRRQSYPFPEPSSEMNNLRKGPRLSFGGNDMDIKSSSKIQPIPPQLNIEEFQSGVSFNSIEQSESEDDGAGRSVTQKAEHSPVVSEIIMGESPTLIFPFGPEETPGAGDVWALATKLVGTSLKTESFDIPKEIVLPTKDEVEVPLSPNALAEYLKEMNEFLETKDAQMKQLSSYGEFVDDIAINSDLQTTIRKNIEDQSTSHLLIRGMDNSASTSKQGPVNLSTPKGGRTPLKKSPVCVVAPLPPETLTPSTQPEST